MFSLCYGFCTLVLLFIKIGLGKTETGLLSCIKPTSNETILNQFLDLGKTLGIMVRHNLIINFETTASTRYILHNNTSHEYITKENASTRLNFTKPTRIFVHGWYSTPAMPPIQALGESYLSLDYNYIVLDWSRLSTQNYVTGCLMIVESMGNHLAEFLAAVSDESDSFLANTVVLGHSCGAQIAGRAGHKLKTRFGKQLGRIVGLEAAGPFFEFPPLVRTLMRGDAAFVFGLYSNPGLYGRRHIYGDFNVLFNGECQPQCVKNINVIGSALCSHFESVYYFADLVVNPTFWAAKCNRGFKDCDSNSAVLLKENINVTGNYFTNATLPWTWMPKE